MLSWAQQNLHRNLCWTPVPHPPPPFIFHQIDGNNNGYIEAREMEALLNRLIGLSKKGGARVTPAEVRAVMDRIDANGDRRIGFDEFVRTMAPLVDGAGDPSVFLGATAGRPLAGEKMSEGAVCLFHFFHEGV